MVSKDACCLIGDLFLRKFLWILDMGLTFDTISVFHLISCIYTLHRVEAHLCLIRRVKTHAPKIDAQHESDIPWRELYRGYIKLNSGQTFLLFVRSYFPSRFCNVLKSGGPPVDAFVPYSFHTSGWSVVRKRKCLEWAVISSWLEDDPSFNLGPSSSHEITCIVKFVLQVIS